MMRTVRTLIRELRKGKTTVRMSAQFGPTFAMRNPELVAQYSDMELIAHKEALMRGERPAPARRSRLEVVR